MRWQWREEDKKEFMREEEETRKLQFLLFLYFLYSFRAFSSFFRSLSHPQVVSCYSLLKWTLQSYSFLSKLKRLLVGVRREKKALKCVQTAGQSHQSFVQTRSCVRGESEKNGTRGRGRERNLCKKKKENRTKKKKREKKCKKTWKEKSQESWISFASFLRALF